MKKFFIVMLAAAVCLAFTLPAMAKVTMGGRVDMEVSYLSQSEERAEDE
jgi:hypothetical protein